MADKVEWNGGQFGVCCCCVWLAGWWVAGCNGELGYTGGRGGDADFCASRGGEDGTARISSVSTGFSCCEGVLWRMVVNYPARLKAKAKVMNDCIFFF